MAIRNGRRVPLSDDDEAEILWLITEGCKYREIAPLFGVSTSTISLVKRGARVEPGKFRTAYSGKG